MLAFDESPLCCTKAAILDLQSLNLLQTLTAGFRSSDCLGISLNCFETFHNIIFPSLNGDKYILKAPTVMVQCPRKFGWLPLAFAWLHLSVLHVWEHSMLVQQALAGVTAVFTSTIQHKCTANIHFYKVESLQAKNMPEMVVIWSIAVYNYTALFLEWVILCYYSWIRGGVPQQARCVKVMQKGFAREIQFRKHCSCGFASASTQWDQKISYWKHKSSRQDKSCLNLCYFLLRCPP